MRNRYLDLLRAVAIVRVVVYHLYGWPWLSIVLPAMGVMFALAGSLAAASLEKRAARQVVTSRLRRLLPPLWLLGLIWVPVMIYLGWAQERHGDHLLDARHGWHLVFWLLPLGDPPGSQAMADLWDPLWYIRAYVWFILLSPLMYLAYRKIGWFAVLAPLAAIVAIDKTGLSLPETADNALWDFVTFAGCWMTGFAHRDGRLSRVRPGVVLLAALLLGAIGMYWLQGHQGDDPWDLNDVPEAQALWSLAFVLLALRWQPRMTWLARVRPLDRLVTFLNTRAVTIYLWHNIAIDGVWPLLALLSLDNVGHHLDSPLNLLTAFLITLAAVLAFGWVEDLAARRRPRFWPRTAPAADVERVRIPGRPTEPAPPLPEPAPPLPEPTHPAGGPTLQLPAVRRPVPWAADLPALDPARDPATGLLIAHPGGPFRPMIAAAPPPSGRHAAGEPDHPIRLDLGLPDPGLLNLALPELALPENLHPQPATARRHPTPADAGAPDRGLPVAGRRADPYPTKSWPTGDPSDSWQVGAAPASSEAESSDWFRDGLRRPDGSGESPQN